MNKEKQKKQQERNGSRLAIPLFFAHLIFVRLWYFVKGKSVKTINSPATFWDIIATGMDKPKEHPEKNSHIDLAIEKAKTYLKNSDMVLDYGCATGSDTFAIARLVKHIDGIDISPKMIDIANRRAVEIEVKNARFFTLSKYDRENLQQYDIIISLYVLHLIDNIKPVLRNIYDLLVPGGIFISSTVCLGGRKSFLSSFLRLLHKAGLIPELALYQGNELVTLIESERFHIVETVDLKTEKHYENLFIVARRNS